MKPKNTLLNTTWGTIQNIKDHRNWIKIEQVGSKRKAGQNGETGCRAVTSSTDPLQGLDKHL